MEQLARNLERDLARLGQRDYSEQGIPVFLVLENRVAGKKPPHGRSNDKERATLAGAFRQHAAAFRLMPADARGADVPKLIEVLAEREFGMTSDRPRL